MISQPFGMLGMLAVPSVYFRIRLSHLKHTACHNLTIVQGLTGVVVFFVILSIIHLFS